MRIAAFVCLCLCPAFAQNPLTLEQAEQTALKSNPQVGASVFNAQVYEQITREVRAGLFPNLSGGVTGAGGDESTRIATGSLNSGTIYNRLSSGVTGSQLLWDFGRTTSLIEASRLRASAQTQDTQFIRGLVVLQVDRAYFSALRAQAVLQVANQTIAARQLVVDQITALFNSKLKSSLDLSFAQVNLSESKLLLVQAQNDLLSSFIDLSTAMGTSAPAGLTYDLAEASVATKPDLESAPLIQQALKNRPDVSASRLESEAARKQIAAEKALSRPSVSAVASVGYVPAHSSLLSDHYAGAGVNLSIPFFNGHAFAARQAQAEYRASSVDQSLRDLENRVTRDVTIAWLGTQTAYQRVGLTAELLGSANQSLDLAQARYDLGLSSIVELSQAQLAKTNAEIQNAAAKYEFQLQSAVLRFQTGATPQ